MSGYANTGKKISIAFTKYFSKLIRQMKGNFVYYLLLLNSRSRQSSFLLTNQNAHLITHELMKFRVKRSNQSSNMWKSPASKRAWCKWKRCQLWILLNLWEKCLKFGENGRNIQTIYDSVRKELQNQCHCAWSLLKVTRTCPIWQSERLRGWEVELLSGPCEVLLVWNHSTSRQGWVYCSYVGGH